jgi:hypothetical protein
VIDAWKAFAAATDAAFPDKVLGIEVLDNNAFPLIDNNGQLVTASGATYVDVTKAIIDAGLEMFEGRFMVQHDGLNSGALRSVVPDAAADGAIAGFQTNHYLQQGTGYGSHGIAIAPTEETYRSTAPRRSSRRMPARATTPWRRWPTTRWRPASTSRPCARTRRT